MSTDLVSILPKLRRYASKLTLSNRDRTDDLVQDTCVRVLANMHLFQPGTNFEAWCTTIMRNHFYQGYRRKAMISTEDIENFGNKYPVAENTTAAIELTQTLEAIDTLSRRRRQTVELAGLGYSMAEMSTKLKMKQGTVKSTLKRARDELERMTA